MQYLNLEDISEISGAILETAVSVIFNIVLSKYLISWKKSLGHIHICTAKTLRHSEYYLGHNYSSHLHGQSLEDSLLLYCLDVIYSQTNEKIHDQYGEEDNEHHKQGIADALVRYKTEKT